ncbi:MAG TPA: response regulator [Casimicrobiaceae bacterium]|nr:response regulator [Casimicrobiaceae bacterium]
MVESELLRSRVCIVDDDSDVAEVLARVVRTVGLQPEVYDSAEAFSRCADSSPIGCLLLDVQLRGMSGLELLVRLSKGQRPYPVFLISAAHNAETSAAARQYGAVLVEKPFDGRALARRVLATIRAARPERPG